MKNELASQVVSFYTPPALNFTEMATRKTVAYVWTCADHNVINGSGRARKEKLKEMQKKKYCPKSRMVEVHNAKAVKKGGTKALANAK